MSTDSTPNPLDTQVLESLRALQTDGQDLIGELVDLLLRDAPPLLEAIRAALARGDAEVLRKSAHRLKGSAASLGAVVLAARLLELEQLGKQNQLEGAPAKAAEVEAEYARACGAGRGNEKVSVCLS